MTQRLMLMAKLADVVHRECAIGFNLRFLRSVAASPDDRDAEICNSTKAQSATTYAITDLGEAVVIQDVALISAVADEP